jgi:hypothetical protein
MSSSAAADASPAADDALDAVAAEAPSSVSERLDALEAELSPNTIAPKEIREMVHCLLDGATVALAVQGFYLDCLRKVLPQAKVHTLNFHESAGPDLSVSASETFANGAGAWEILEEDDPALKNAIWGAEPDDRYHYLAEATAPHKLINYVDRDDAPHPENPLFTLKPSDWFSSVGDAVHVQMANAPMQVNAFTWHVTSTLVWIPRNG